MWFVFFSKCFYNVPRARNIIFTWIQNRARALKVLGQGHVYKATFGQFGIFADFPLTFAEPKIYLYLTDSKIFGCFEKLWVWIVHFCCLSLAEQDCDTPWYLFFGKNFWIPFLWFFVRFWLNRFQKNHIPLCTQRPQKTPGIDVLYPTWALLKILDKSIKRQKSYGG